MSDLAITLTIPFETPIRVSEKVIEVPFDPKGMRSCFETAESDQIATHALLLAAEAGLIPNFNLNEVTTNVRVAFVEIIVP